MYRERIRVDAPFVTPRGQGRKRTRIEFPQLSEDFTRSPDKLGRAVINRNAGDFVLENLTAANTAGIVGPHESTIHGSRCDRTASVDRDVLSEGPIPSRSGTARPLLSRPLPLPGGGRLPLPPRLVLRHRLHHRRDRGHGRRLARRAV